ncbi:hypothetical protein ACFCZ1_26970 [Streptomyces sp. NPDC056224]|uniref:hypothetical protein n=1 Tax=Streptomyces sp. NPDC056224 TaxID=3345750 RepID=UPI0035E32EFB
MPTFGKTGECTAPAVWLIEDYSGKEDEDMSLDRTVYACEQHRETAERLWLRGLSPDTHRARGRLNWCGQFTDYDPRASG